MEARGQQPAWSESVGTTYVVGGEASCSGCMEVPWKDRSSLRLQTPPPPPPPSPRLALAVALWDPHILLSLLVENGKRLHRMASPQSIHEYHADEKPSCSLACRVSEKLALTDPAKLTPGRLHSRVTQRESRLSLLRQRFSLHDTE